MKPFSKFKVGSALVLGRLFPNLKVFRRRSKLRFVRDFYRDYKSLKRKRNEMTDDDSSYASRRQRLLGFARTTRDTYIPRLASLVTLLASGRVEEPGQVPSTSQITLFPSYTRESEGSYVVHVRGWLSCPGVMSRKNRLILSLAKQITRYGATPAADAALHKLEDSDSDVASEVLSLASERPPLTHDDVIRERLKAFIARSIPDAQLQISIGSEKPTESVCSTTVTTDDNGNFHTEIAVPYRPSVVQVRAEAEDTVFAFQDVMYVPNRGLGLISDIDDTIKLTGVIGDKRELMANLLLNDVLTWTIPAVVRWYNHLLKDGEISFHYVSNSPWQLFTVIEKYFKAASIPVGSVHLKQYTGNLISSLMEPSSSRKKRSLTQILNDFPEKLFICVGDSGEHDLEAYVDLAAAYPNRVVAIYIRYVENSLSDVDDGPILEELRRIISVNAELKKLRPKKNPPVADELIDLAHVPTQLQPAEKETPPQAKSLKPLPPLKPAKPDAIKGNKLQQASTSSSLSAASPPPPPPPRRTTTIADLAEAGVDVPPLPQRPTTSDFDVYDRLQHLYDVDNFWELEETDERGARWLLRITTALEQLNACDTELRIFKDSDEDFFRKAFEDASKHIYRPDQ